jgi:flavin reductase (DIM6/NTAB) family NADH-FMN oxidoreductase RutF
MAELFRRITLGVYVIGVPGDPSPYGFTACCVTQTSFTPPMLAVAVNPDHASYPPLQASGVFSVSVLGSSQISLAEHFGAAAPTSGGKWRGIPWRPGPHGSPLLISALATFECTVVTEVPAGDHRLVIGRVAAGEIQEASAKPLLYADTGNLDGSAALYPDSFA